jgi:hypothetical protein
MRKRQQPRHSNVGTGGGMDYVICPKCGDPVAGRFTAQLTCRHCKEIFSFDKSKVQYGIVTLDGSANRWKAGS